MSRITIGASLAVLVALAAAAAVVVIAIPWSAASSRVGVGLNAPSIAGFPGDFSGGEVFLTGGGAYDPASASNADPESAFVRSNGGFRCLADVQQGPLKGCLQGQGVRWDTDGLLQSTRFKCTARDRAREDRGDRRAHRSARVRLLSRWRRQRRVVQGRAGDRLRPRPRPRHRRSPERLDPAGRLWHGERQLQFVTTTGTTHHKRAPCPVGRCRHGTGSSGAGRRVEESPSRRSSAAAERRAPNTKSPRHLCGATREVPRAIPRRAGEGDLQAADRARQRCDRGGNFA